MPRTFFCVSNADVFYRSWQIPYLASEPDGSHPLATPGGSLGECLEIWKERKEPEKMNLAGMKANAAVTRNSSSLRPGV